MVCATLVLINPPDRLKFNHKSPIAGQNKKTYELIKMSHFPSRKRRKNLLTADKTETKTKAERREPKATHYELWVCVFGGGKRALALYNEPWNESDNRYSAQPPRSDYNRRCRRRTESNAERRWRLATIALTLALMNMSTLCQSETRRDETFPWLRTDRFFPSPVFPMTRHRTSSLISRQRNELMWLLPWRWLWWDRAGNGDGDGDEGSTTGP